MTINITRLVLSKIFLCIITLGIVSVSWATSSCEPVEVTADMVVVGPLIPGPDPFAVGEISFSLPDGTRGGLATAFLVAPPKFTDDGTIHLTLHAIHDLSNGDSVTWLAKQVHSPTEIPGEFTVNERVTIINGTGIFSEAFGRGTGHGESSLNTFQAHIEAKTRICDF